MKVSRESIFKPITLVLESEVEVELMYAMLNNCRGDIISEDARNGKQSIVKKAYDSYNEHFHMWEAFISVLEPGKYTD